MMFRSGKLQPSLNDPNWIGSRPGDNPSICSSDKMYPSVLLSIVELISDDLFTVSVGEEVDGSGWDYPYEGWTEAFE